MTDIASLGNFYRDAIPQDITDGESPNPSTWNEPAAQLSPTGCNPLTSFANHSIIFGQSHWLHTSVLGPCSGFGFGELQDN